MGKGKDLHRYPRHERSRRPYVPRPGATDLDVASERMFEAYAAMRKARTNEPWFAWQAAAADYYVLRHPEAQALRRSRAGGIATVTELVARGEALNRFHRAFKDEGYRDPDEVARISKTGWFHELIAGVFGPIDQARSAVRQGDLTDVEILVRFLEADVYCFRSGYEKGYVADTLKGVTHDGAVADRLRIVVLAVVDGYDRREFRAYVRLARSVDSPELQAALEARLGAASPTVRRHARWVLDGLQG
ncbi:MAG TPA: hypothetical protein VGM28_01010 [Candidatus Limnocylindrales bacterium]|jgi:hypothetical protein